MPGLRLVVLILGLLVPHLATAALTPGDQRRTLVSGGIERTYLLHVPPSYDGGTAVPLVLDVHGFLSNADQQFTISGMVKVADREGFLLVHPQAIGNGFNANLCCTNPDLDDVGFMRDLVAAVSAEGHVDATRIYATGLSNGGGMAQRLACDAADLFAAAAPMAFPIPFEPLSECRPSRAIPVLTFMGLTDVLVMYDGGLFPSAPATIAYWRNVDGCQEGPADQVVVQGASRCETWTRCTAGVEAGLCSITAHTFGGAFFDGHILYANDDFVLADVAWAFLSRFRLPERHTALTARVHGTERLRLAGSPASKQAVDWQVTIGAGTWSVETADGTVFGGSARKRGRRLTLSLTADGRDVLLALLGARAGAVAGHPVDLTMLDDQLRATLKGRRLALAGRVRLTEAAGGGDVAWSVVGRPARGE